MKSLIPTTLFVVLLLLSVLEIGQGSITMSSGSTIINTYTEYSINIAYSNDISTLDAGGYTILTFPSSDYSSSAVANSSCAGVTCGRSATSYNISNSFFSSGVMSFNITNILNPGRAGGPEFSYTVYNSAGTMTELFSAATVLFYPGSLQSCVVSYSPNNVRRVGTATIAITPGNPILPLGNIIVRFPQKWAFIINNDSTISASTLTCSLLNNSVTTGLSCSLASSGSDFLITFTAPFSTTVNTSFSLTINPILSIPISYNSNEVWVMTQDSSGFTIDQSTFCSTSPPSANTFTMSTLTTTLVSRSFAPNIMFRSTDIINSNDTIRVTLPSDISFGNASLMMTFNESGSSFLKSVNYDNSNSNTSSYSYAIGSLAVGGKTYANSNTTVNLTNMLLHAPPTSKPSGNIEVSLYRSSNIYSTGTISITALTNLLTSAAMSAVSTIVNRQTNYTVSFVTASPLTSSGSITIQLPTSITAPDYSAKSCVVSGSTNVSSSGMCSISSRVLTVTGAFTGLVAASSTFAVTFDGVTNPESISPTSVFRINTFYDSTTTGFPVDVSTTLTFTATSDTIVSFTVTPGSFIVNARPVYTIVYTLSNKLPAGGTVLIGLPIGMSLVNPNSASVMVTIGAASAVSNTPAIVTTSNGVYSTALNFSGLATSAALSAGTVITFQVSSIINPSSTKPSSTFSAYSFSQGFLIESLTSGVTVTMTTPAAFSLASVTPNSNKNGDSTFYMISIMPSLSIPANSILQVTIPSDVTLSASPVCSNMTSTTSTLTCNYTSNILSLSLGTTALISGAVYSYQVDGFTNPRTMTTSGSFTIQCLTFDFYAISLGTASGIKNTLPNNLITLTSSVITPSQSYLNSNQTIRFTMTTKNALMSTDYIILSFPSVYTYIGATGTTTSICSEPSSNYNCLPDSSNNLTVKITGNWNNQTSFSFTVKDYRSPGLMQYISMTTYFQVYTKQSDGTDIDVTDTTNANTKTTFTISCDSNCQTCGTPITNCSSCYASTITNNQYLQNNVCVSTCTTGNYPDSATSSCKPCVSPCSTCTSAAICLSCLSTVLNKFFDSTTSTCVSTCPNGYYSSVDVCVPCSQSCQTCSGTSTNCTSCNSTYVMFNNTCTTICPTKYFNSSGLCLDCDASCLTCQGTASFCLTCESGYVTNGTAGVCTNTCPAGKVPYLGSCGCLVSCLTCSGTFDNCQSCNASETQYRLFYSNSCIGSCPTSTYQNSGTCTNCTTGCSVCSSAIVCSACNATYYLYNSGCLTSCPSGTFISGSTCNNCSSTCATCSNLATNCTSCSTGSLQGGQCVATCAAGSISVSTVNGLVCTACTLNCSTCSGTLTNCTACLASSGTSLLNGECRATCPDGTTSVLSKCEFCESPCLTCNVTTKNCLSCLGGFFKIGQSTIQCVSSCSAVGLFTNGTECISCQSPCSSCSGTATNCTSCITTEYLLGNNCVTSCGTGYYAYQGQCMTSCPNGTVASGTTCADPTNNSTNETNTTNSTTENLTTTLQSSKIIPFPFFIADSLVIGLAVISKFSATETCIPAMSVSFGSLLEFCSWVVVLIVISVQDSKLYVFRRLLFTTDSLTSKGVLCLLIGGAVHYILNIINFAFYLRYISTDPAYKKWLRTPANSRVHKATLAISLIVSHKFSNLPFSKCFGSSCFKAPLSRPVVYTPLSVVSGLGFIVSILMILGCGLIVYDSTTVLMSSLFIQAIDVIVITALILLLSIWNFRKPDGFFDQDLKETKGTEEIYNDTLAGMVNNHSEFGERVSVDEMEERMVGNKNYSRVQPASKMQKTSKPKHSQRQKEANVVIFNPDKSQQGLNIHDMSSEFVSSEHEEERYKELPKIQADTIQMRKAKEGENNKDKPAQSNIQSGLQSGLQSGAQSGAPSNRSGKQKDAIKVGKNKENGTEQKLLRKSGKNGSHQPAEGSGQQQQKSDKNDPNAQLVKNTSKNILEIKEAGSSKDGELEEEKKSSSIIDKMRDSSEFAVENQEGVQAANPAGLLNKNSTKKQSAPSKNASGVSSNGSPVNKEGKSANSSSIFKKTNKIAPLQMKGSAEDFKEDSGESNQEAKSVASSEQRLQDNEIQWNQQDPKQKKSKSPSKNNLTPPKNGASTKEEVNKAKGKNKNSKSPQKKIKKAKNKTITDKSGIDDQQQEQIEQQLIDKNNRRTSEDVDDDNRNGQDYEPVTLNGNKSQTIDNKSKSPGKEVQQKSQGTPNKGLTHMKSNQSVRQKPKLKSDNEASRSVREKSLNIKHLKKNAEQEELPPGKQAQQIDSVDLDQIVPSVPSELPLMGFPDKSKNDLVSQTLGVRNAGRKKYIRKANQKDDSMDEQAFPHLKNESVIKTLDESDEVPCKPRMLHDSDDNELRSKQTKIDSDFVNKYYNDDESLRSVEDANVQFNEISPSEFNIQNQRYEDSVDFMVPGRTSVNIPPNPSNRVPEKGRVTADFQRSDQHIMSNHDTVSYKGSEADISNRVNYPKRLQPERKHNLPPLGDLYERDPDEYKSFSKLDSVGYDGIYQKIEASGENKVGNQKKMRDLEKIYLQRLDFKGDSRRRSTNSAFNKKNFLDEYDNKQV